MSSQQSSSVLHQQRVVRVFVSSTFRDMHAERDELIKQVFPQLRKLCEERGVTWGEVDLRWGVTDEQKAEGKVLPICLAEINNCRPYFIGLLGERYGWVPDEIPQELIEREPWLAEHSGQSVTELEILHGVLNNPAMADHALFYFRDPSFIDSLPHEQQSDFLEIPTSDEIGRLGQEEAERRAADRRKKLAALKDRVRASCLRVRENYSNPHALGELVLRDLTDVIDHLYPADERLDPLDRDALDHEAFAQSRAQVYIGRQEYFDRLDEHVQGDGQPVVVLGESGSGKSALLANWAVRYRARLSETLPRERKSRWRRLTDLLRLTSTRQGQPLLLMHFIGATPYSADWAAMLRRIMGEFKRRFHIQQKVPDQPDALRVAFANWLHMAAAQGKVVLILDALNQLEDRDGAPDLVWLPPEIPPNIRLIVSTLPGRPLDDLNNRRWTTLDVEPLEAHERKQLITDYLAQYTKALSRPRVERIASADQTANPLYLRALLDELRVHGDHYTLDHRIEHYLNAATVAELYEKILKRYEEDYERDRAGLVRDTMSLLWAARRGLSEVELMNLLGIGQEPLPRAHWSPLHLAAESSLVSRSGLIGLGHDYMRQAAEDKYLPDEQDRLAAHMRLADYFGGQALGPRKIDELPWQLVRAKAWRQLCDLLTDLQFFIAAWDASQFEVKTYWAEIEANSQLRVVNAYQSVLDAPAENIDYGWRVALLLADTGHTEEALLLRGQFVEYFRESGDDVNLSTALGSQALILAGRGQLDEGMRLHKEQERISRKLGNKDGLSISLGNQAKICYARGEFDEAMRLHKEEERICRKLGDRNGLSISLGSQANIFYARSEMDEAMRLYKAKERICRELGNKDALSDSLAGQAIVLKAWGELDEAMRLHKEEERICRELGNKNGLRASFGNQALIVAYRGELNEAMRLHREEERICRELGNKEGLSISLGNQGNIFYVRGDLDEAMRLHKEKERICRELGNEAGLSKSLAGQALILDARGESDAAMRLHKEVERIYRELGDKDGLQRCLGNQASILAEGGEFDEAMRLHSEEERICRELGNKDGLQACLGGQALILKARGELAEAMRLHKEEERICRELDNKSGLARSLINQALLLAQQMGRPNQALPLAEEAYRIATGHGLIRLAQQIKPILDSVRSWAR